jgi:malate dehydrogenase (oxaloacetate-decarboxylating)(NADP+)
VIEAYGGRDLRFGPEYLIPKPLDPRVLLWVAPAVAEAAVKDGTSPLKQFDVEAYRRSLERYLGGTQQVMAALEDRARRAKARVAFAEGDEPRAQRAAAQMVEEGLGRPVLVGEDDRIRRTAQRIGVDLSGMEIVDPLKDARREQMARRLYDMRCRKGVNLRDADHLVKSARRYALLLLEGGEVECAVTGVNRSFPSAVRDALQIVGTRHGHRAAAVHIMVLKDRTLFLADTSLNPDPDARQLADVAIAGADMARKFDLDPRVALLSFSNFGSVPHPKAARSAEAVKIVRAERPDLVIDGEMHADVALDRRVGNRFHPQSLISGDANVLVFPDLASGNIGYKLLEHLAGAEAIGPILVGMNRPVVVSYQAARVQTLVNLTAIAIGGATSSVGQQQPLFA